MAKGQRDVGNSLVAKLSSGEPGVVGSSPGVSTSPLTFWEILIGGSMNLDQAYYSFRDYMLDNAIEELVEQGYLKINHPL